MDRAVALDVTHADTPLSGFDYKNAVRSILPRLAAATDESDRQRRLSDDAAMALRESASRA